MKPDVPETRKIVLFGASVRAAAQSAARAGWSVIGVDWFGDVDARQACDQLFVFQNLQSSDDWTTFHQTVGGIPRLQVGGLDHQRIALVEHLDPSTACNGPAVRRLSIGKEPLEFAKFCVSLPISFPPSFGSLAQWQGWNSNRTITNQEPDPLWILKPRGGSGGVNVQWVDLIDIESVDFEKFFVQRFIEGTVYGATCFGDGKRSWVVGICQSIVHSNSDHPFSYGGSIGPVEIESGAISSVDHIADLYVQQSECRGMFNIDFILDSGGQLWLLEINDRMGASTELIETAADVSLVDRAIRLRYGESIPWKDFLLKNSPVLCKRVLYADADQRFDLSGIQQSYPSAIRICDLPADHTLVESGSPICTIIEPFQRESSFLEPSGLK